ncbi:MAG: copper resistance CopC family protein [Pseudomonadota bacterium]
MNVRRIILSVVIVMTVLLSAKAFAHAMLEKSDPANGAVLQAVPKNITLQFGHPAKLTTLKLNNGDKDIPVTIDLAAAASTTFVVPLPSLEKGKYQVKWSALSGDAHVMTGVLSFTISSGN